MTTAAATGQITATELATRLRATIAQAWPSLQELSEIQAATRPGGGEGWVRKEELGHLLDSATNNRVRFVVAALEGSFNGPKYDQTGWVQLGGYAGSPWSELLDAWAHANSLLANVVERVPGDRLQANCSIAGDTVTLQFLIEDYINHMQHHLDHILLPDSGQ